MFWDEDNRLMVLSDNGKTSRYTYNAGGERIIKSHGSMEGVYINGAPQGITFHETDEFTLYPASIITVNRHRFTKHYFIGDKRVASRLGLGEFRNVYGSNGSNVTAGQQDYAERMNQIENQREAYYRKAGVAPGLPTMKGSYADPEVTGVGYNVLIDSLGDHSVPENWVQHPVVNTEAGSNPGAPLAWGSPENPDDAVAGYGYVPCDTSEVEETFYYHSDHLGSTSYITDQQANVTQYDAYLPYGELLVDEHSSSADLPYKFNGKELDEETGLYYYGARYMNPVTSMWYGVDPLTESAPLFSAFVYASCNPIGRIDPDGNQDDNWGFVVDMSKAPTAQSFTVSGFARNSRFFWKQMVAQHPEMFSKRNIENIGKGRAPIVDEQWIKYNKTHKTYMGNKLIHHHIGQGRFAAALPEQDHVKNSSNYHSTKLNKVYKNRPNMKFGFKVVGALNLIPIITDSPHNPLYTFVRPGEGEQNRCYYDVLTNQYWEYSVRGDVREVRTYESYTRIKGKWRGVNMISKQHFDKNGKETGEIR